jgi:gamma-glutamylcyclotransferase (GGCT)/AIG2-like uncharacterized protein YtfP
MDDFQQFVADALANTGWSNDVPLLESQEEWFVFTYSSNRGKVSSYFTHPDSDAQFVSIGWTRSNIYSILKVEDGSKTNYLATLQGTDRILGEVWKIPTGTLLELDCDERNLLQTKRIRIPVSISQGQTVDAWIYTAHPKYLLDGGVRVSKYTGYTWYGSDTKFLEVA